MTDKCDNKFISVAAQITFTKEKKKEFQTHKIINLRPRKIYQLAQANELGQ